MHCVTPPRPSRPSLIARLTTICIIHLCRNVGYDYVSNIHGSRYHKVLGCIFFFFFFFLACSLSIYISFLFLVFFISLVRVCVFIPVWFCIPRVYFYFCKRVLYVCTCVCVCVCICVYVMFVFFEFFYCFFWLVYGKLFCMGGPCNICGGIAYTFWTECCCVARIMLQKRWKRLIARQTGVIWRQNIGRH